MKFILTRHTTTEWNLVHRIQGHTDTDLAPQGISEAVALAKELAGKGISLVVSSDLRRAQQTAHIIASHLNVPLRLEPRLRECAFGRIEGFTREQASRDYGSSLATQLSDYRGYDFRLWGGEHRDAVFERHRAALDELANESTQKVVLLVGHGRGMTTLLAGLGHHSELPRGAYREIEYA